MLPRPEGRSGRAGLTQVLGLSNPTDKESSMIVKLLRNWWPLVLVLALWAVWEGRSSLFEIYDAAASTHDSLIGEHR